jgi:hypothetical protein
MTGQRAGCRLLGSHELFSGDDEPVSRRLPALAEEKLARPVVYSVAP